MGGEENKSEKTQNPLEDQSLLSSQNEARPTNFPSSGKLRNFLFCDSLKYINFEAETLKV